MTVQNKLKDDPAIASRYLADQLTPEERDAFEAELLKSPEVAEELEATARLKVGLARLKDTGELSKLAGHKPWFQRPTFFAAAAMVPIAAIGLLLARSALLSQPDLLVASPTALVAGLQLGQTHPIERLRGSSYDLQFTLPEHHEAIELRVRAAAVSTAGRYNVALSQIQDSGASVPVATLKGLQATSDQFVSMYADSALLKPGRYQLVVTPVGSLSSDQEEIFLIRVRPPGSETSDAE